MEHMDVQDVIDRFNQAWGAHDLEATLALITDDCVFDGTGPAPDGVRCVGKDEIRAAWNDVFADTTSRFDTEDAFVAGDDRYVALWRYDWGDGHVRGVDVFKVRD